MIRRPPRSTLFPYPPPFGSRERHRRPAPSDEETARVTHTPGGGDPTPGQGAGRAEPPTAGPGPAADRRWSDLDRKSTRLNSSHANISYAVFCLTKKKPST